ncbi:AAA family ATPase [Nonomuraea sp. NPDC050310]|uniref:AAA family ATPase n=1 Tax=unclassified Nonomuraea TaxID=2593643 RepID=UPI0033CB8B2A
MTPGSRPTGDLTSAARSGLPPTGGAGGTTSGGSLRFPAGSLVILTGLPGAGKSTLLRRLYGLTGQEAGPVAAGPTRVIDSGQARLRWARTLAWAPKPVRTFVVHCTHLSRIARNLAAGHSVVAHNRGTWSHILYGFAWLARRHGREFHLIMLDVDAATAMEGQQVRGRVVPRATFDRHAQRWRVLVRRARATGALAPATGVTVLDRAGADRVTELSFTGPGAPAQPPTAA